MKRFIYLLSVTISIGLLVYCSSSPQNTGDKIRIVTSIYPLQDLTQQIAGEYADVIHLIPAGANPHHFEPPPSIIRQLQNVDLFVGVHPAFDGWIEDLLPSQTSRLYLYLNANINKTEHCEFPEDDHSFNPHFWLSVRSTQKVLGQIAKTLCETDTLHCKAYNQNLIDYKIRLDSLDQEIRGQLYPFKGKAFIQWHQAWDGFASDYGLRITGTLEYGHGDALPMRSFQKIIQNAKSEGVRLVVIGLNVESDAAFTLIRELDGKLLRLDTIGGPEKPNGNTYMKLMASNARLLAQAFGEF